MNSAVGLVIGLPPSLSRQLTLPLVDAFRRELPKARLAIVEGLSTHLAEWIATGRVDIGLLHNPEGQAAIETTPILEEALCLVEPAPARRLRVAPLPLPFVDLQHFRLVVPERSHAIRRLLETRAALLGMRLDIAWEVSSVSSIIDLVAAGYGHAVLAASAVAASGRGNELSARPLRDPRLVSTLALATATSKRASPLAKHAMRLLPELVLQGVRPAPPRSITG